MEEKGSESDGTIQRQVQHMVSIKKKGEDQCMLKIRLMGTKKDIAWFKKIMQCHPDVRVVGFSDLYTNKGTKQYYRSYAEVQKDSGKTE